MDNDQLVQLILDVLGKEKEPLTARQLRKLLIRRGESLTLTQVNSKLYALLSQKNSKIKKIEEEGEAPKWSLKQSKPPSRIVVEKECTYHLGSRWKIPEFEYIELKGSKEKRNSNSLYWSLDDFRKSFNKNAGKTVVAFLNTTLKAEFSVDYSTAKIIFGTFDRSQLIHGVWIDCNSKDHEGECNHLADQLSLALRQQFSEFYEPKSQYQSIMDHLSITISPVVDGLLNGRYFVVLIIISIDIKGSLAKLKTPSTWQGRLVYRDGSSTLTEK